MTLSTRPGHGPEEGAGPRPRGRLAAVGPSCPVPSAVLLNQQQHRERVSWALPRSVLRTGVSTRVHTQTTHTQTHTTHTCAHDAGGRGKKVGVSSSSARSWRLLPVGTGGQPGGSEDRQLLPQRGSAGAGGPYRATRWKQLFPGVVPPAEPPRELLLAAAALDSDQPRLRVHAERLRRAAPSAGWGGGVSPESRLWPQQGAEQGGRLRGRGSSPHPHWTLLVGLSVSLSLCPSVRRGGSKRWRSDDI